MKKDNKYLYLLAGILLGSFFMWIASGVNSNDNFYGPLMGNRNSEVKRDNVDAHFIEQMIPHHVDAVTMSELALQKALKPEVKELAASIISSQTKEIENMRNWYKDWFEKNVPEDESVMNQHGMKGRGMHMGMMGGEVDIENLKNSEDFDREFIEQMIPHHQMAIMMATMLENSTSRPEMKQLTEDIITAQTSEINMMREWISEWE